MRTVDLTFKPFDGAALAFKFGFYHFSYVFVHNDYVFCSLNLKFLFPDDNKKSVELLFRPFHLLRSSHYPYRQNGQRIPTHIS